ncbi:hypothetical protein SAMN04488116_2716 [Flagellimonas flava]|uniref:Phospholipase_D-nuclease N-terminal n=1 Tax=Flagellimonas flava TaxID=570519 RepID=A0A1M5N9W9_9FLAO|nr:hypothetical protein SAMN04488116_2716 [Allomuricauda flava]
MLLVIQIFLTLLATYFIIGLAFALFFVFGGATKLDPLMKDSKKMVRVLLFPGVVATWPFLLRNLIRNKS